MTTEILHKRFSGEELKRMSEHWVPYLELAENTEHFVQELGDYVGHMDAATISRRYGSPMNAEAKKRERMEALRKNPPGPNHIVVVFRIDDEIHGICHGLLDPDTQLFEIGTSVGREYRNRGVGYAMLKMVECVARNGHHGAGLYISTEPDNRGMRELAATCGFEHTGTRYGGSEWKLLFD